LHIFILERQHAAQEDFVDTALVPWIQRSPRGSVTIREYIDGILGAVLDGLAHAAVYQMAPDDREPMLRDVTCYTHDFLREAIARYAEQQYQRNADGDEAPEPWP
jgi:hypothetical protein